VCFSILLQVVTAISSMPVSMMQVRVMRMTMGQILVFMLVHVRFCRVYTGRMFMLMMFIVDMPVGMYHPLVSMLVRMPLRQSKPETQSEEA
jgi:hypothetical protein